MKFIYFIDAKSKEEVLAEGIYPTPNSRKINQESSGIFCYPLIRIPFKTPVVKDDYEDINDYLRFKKEEDLLNQSLSIEEAWEVVGASRVTRRDHHTKEVSGVIFRIEKKYWPMTVFINIRHSIANEFARVLENNPNKGIHFGGYENNLLKTVRKIGDGRYVIASAPFTVNTEDDLLDLIHKFEIAGGGIWKEDSFECMLTEHVSQENIEKIIKLENRYYKSLVPLLLGD